MSIREITSIQGSPGTVVAGAHLDEQQESMVRRLNSLETRDMTRQASTQVWCSEYTPPVPGTLLYSILPWMPNCNTALDASPNQTPTAFKNKWRTKGDWNDDIDPQVAGKGKIYQWEWAVRVPSSAILRQWDITILQDATYSNQMQYTATPPPNHNVVNGSVWDITLEVLADSPYSPEDRTQTSVLLYSKNFRLDTKVMNQIITAASTTMLPVLADPEGWWINQEDLSIPVPAETTLRFILSIPQYSNAAWSDWGDEPWGKNTWSQSVHVDYLVDSTGGTNG